MLSQSQVMHSAIVLCLVTGAAGAASMTEIIDVPSGMQTRYQVGTLGDASSALIQGEAAQERSDSIQQQSTFSMSITEQALPEEESAQGLLVHTKKQAVETSAFQTIATDIKKDLKKEGLSNAFSLLEDSSQHELSKALKNAMILKETKAIDHMTLEETLAKQEQQKLKIIESGKKFAELFETLKTRRENCQQCLQDCPARIFKKYEVGSEQECMKNCELVICKEVWNPLAGSYLQQLREFNSRSQADVQYAKSSLFTNYLDSYLKNKGEQSMYYEDEDTETEIVWDQPSAEQLKNQEEHDAKLERFNFVFEREKKVAPKAPASSAIEINQQEGEHHVLSMLPAEDEQATRLSRTALEAEFIAKSAAFGIPAEWISSSL